MVTLKIAGLVIALLFGLGFTPTYLDYLPLGRAMRRGVVQVRANPAFAVALVLSCASLIPLGMLLYALLNGTGIAAVIGFLLAFLIAAAAAFVLTPPPRGLDLGPAPRSYVEEFMEEA